MTIYANLTSSFGYFYGANPQDAKLDFSRVFDFFTPYHHTVFENLSDLLSTEIKDIFFIFFDK